MPGSKRGTRRDEFLTTGGPFQSFSQDLLASTFALLSFALADRRGPVWRERTNHHTRHAPAVVVLAVTAFDAWLTEYALSVQAVDDAARKHIADKSTWQRCEAMMSRFGAPNRTELLDELRTLIDVRDEIVHYLPRLSPSGGTLPAWVKRLPQKGFLITAATALSDFTFWDKLTSYALAYWACTVVESCASALAEVAPQDHAHFMSSTVANFAKYRAIVSPSQLERLDSSDEK